MSEIDQFEEIQEILEFILKQEFIQPEDIDLVSSKFKNTFLTIENKEEFFPFLNKFVKEVEGNDIYHEDRVESLKTEIESFYDRIGTNFSVYHVAGYRDPNDPDNSEKLSDDGVDWEFPDGQYRAPVFGPQIPEDKKAQVQKVLEKISALYEQKNTNRIQVVQKWRQLRLANYIKIIKSQVPALSTIQKYMMKKYHVFYRLKSWNDLKNQENSQAQKDLINKYQKEIEQLKKELQQKEQEKLMNGLKQKKDDQLENEIQRLKEQIASKIKENENLKTLFENQKKQLQETQNNDKEKMEQLEKLKNILSLLEKNKGKLDQDLERRNKELEDANNALENSQRKIDDLLRDALEWKKKYDAKDLKSFQKTRYFMKIMKLFEIRLLSFGFMKIFKRKEKAKLALMNVTDRIKARLLIQTRNLNCGQDIQKSFLRWMLKAKPDFLREQISKIPLTGRINQPIALWRMKKLVFKPIVKKLSESAKALRRLKAIYYLNKIIKNRQFMDMYNFWKQVNPNHKTRERVKIEEFFDKLDQRGKQQKKIILEKLIKNKDKQKNILRRLFDKKYNQMRVVFWMMRMKNRSQRQMNDLLTIQKNLDRLVRNKRESGQKFLNLFKNQNIKTSSMITKLVNSQQSKMRNVFDKLKGNNTKGIFEEVKSSYLHKFEDIRKQGTAKILRDNYLDQMRKVLNYLRQHKNLCKRKDKIEKMNQDKLRSVLNLMKNKKTQLKKNALDFLRDNNRNYNNKLNQKEKALFLIQQRLNRLKREGLNHLKDVISRNKKLEEMKQNSLMTMFRVMQNNQRVKVGQAIQGLRENHLVSKEKDKQLKNLLNRKIFKERSNALRKAYNALIGNYNDSLNKDTQNKSLKSLAIMLKNSQLRKTKLALLKLVANKREQQRKEGIMNSIKKNYFSKLLDNLKTAKRNALLNLIENKNRLNQEQSDRDQRIKGMINDLLKNYNNAKKKYFDALRINMRDLKNKKQDKVLFNFFDRSKDNLRKYFDLLKKNKYDNEKKAKHEKNLKMKSLSLLLNNNKLKMNQCLNKLKWNANSNRLMDLKDVDSKHKLLSKMIYSQKIKSQQGFYKLILNRIQEIQKQKEKEKQQQRLLDLLNRFNLKKKNAFDILRKNNQDQINLKQSQMDALNNLFEKQKLKRNSLMVKMVQNNLDLKNQEEIKKLQSQNDRFLLDQKKALILQRLIDNNQNELSEAYKILKENKNLWKKKQEFENKKKSKFLKLFFNKILNKNKDALDKLRENNNAIKQSLLNDERIEAIKLKVFGVTDNDLSKNRQFKEMIGRIHLPQQRNFVKGDHFQNLIEYMEENEPDDRYDNILKRIHQGEIQTVNELRYHLNQISKGNNKYNELNKQIDNPRLELENFERWMKVNNADGRYDPILKGIANNKDYNKIDMYNYLDKNNQDGKFNTLRNKFNNQTQTLELIDFMRRNNGEGNYDEALEFLNKKENPNLKDFLNYIERHNENGQMNGILDRLNQAGANKQIRKLIKFMKNNNGDNRYDQHLNYLRQQKVPKLSHLAEFCRKNNDETSIKLIKRLNFDVETPAEKLLKKIQSKNKSGSYNNILKKIQAKKNSGVYDMYKILKESDKNGTLTKPILQDLDIQAPIDKYQLFMKRNNTNNKYNQITKALKTIPNAKMTDLLNSMVKFAKNNDIQELIDMVEKEYKNDLTDFLQRKNIHGQYDEVIQMYQKSKNIFEFYQYLIKNKKQIDYQPILSKIDKEDEDFPTPFQYLMNIINELKHEEQGVMHLYERIKNSQNPTFSEALEMIIKNNKYGNFDRLLKNLNTKPVPVQIQNLKSYINQNPENLDYKDINELLQNSPNLYDLFNYIEDNSKNLVLYVPQQILNEDYVFDLYDKGYQFMKVNNDTNIYTELLKKQHSHLNPKIESIFENIQELGNDDGRFNNLIDVFNQKSLQKKFENLFQWMKNNNKNSLYDDMFKHLSQYKIPTLSNLVDYIKRNNMDGRFDPLIAKIIGKKLSSKLLINILKRNNRSGLYNPIIEYLESNPLITTEELIEYVKKLNTDGRFNRLLDFILGVTDTLQEGGNDLEDELIRMRNTGNFENLFENISSQSINNPRSLLKYLESNNEDGKYDALINMIKNYLGESDEMTTKIPSGTKLTIQRAVYGKLSEVLKQLRNFNRFKAEEQKRKQDKIKKLFTDLLKNQTINKLKYLNHLRRYNNEKNKSNSTQTTALRKGLNRLIQSLESKKVSCMIKLHQWKNQEKEKEKEIHSKLGNVLSGMKGHSDKKMIKILDSLRNNNKVMKELQIKLAKKMTDAYEQKVKDSIQLLVARSKKDKQNKQILLKVLQKAAQKHRNLLKDALQKLNENKNQKKREDICKEKLTKRIMHNLNNGNRSNLKKFLNQLREFNSDSKQQTEIKNTKLSSVFRDLNKGNKSKIQQIFNELRRHNLREKIKENAREQALKKLFREIQKGSSRKQSFVFGSLINNKHQDVSKQSKINSIIKLLIEKQKLKEKIATQVLRNHNNDMKEKEMRERDRIRNLFQKIFKRLATKPFYKLIENSLRAQKKDSDMRTVFKQLEMASKLKESSNLHEMNKNALKEMFERFHKKKIIEKMILKQDLKKKQVLQNLQNFIYNKKNKIEDSIKIIRKNILQDQYYFYRILKMHRFLQDRNKTNRKLTSMLYCLRKNHKVLMRDAMNHWAGTELKTKITNGTSKLEILINRRLNQGYQSIKKHYLYLKFENFINGLMKLITVMENKINDHKEYFWNQLYERNPWYQKVIDIWTLKSRPNFQIAFWKMRYSKNLKKEGISAEESLRMKKLIYILNIKIQKNMSHGFWKIHANSDSMNGKNSTFVQMIKKL